MASKLLDQTQILI